LSTPPGFQAAYLAKVREIEAWATGGGLTQIGAASKRNRTAPPCIPLTAFPGIDLGNFPHLLRWTERIAAQPRWRHPYELLPRGLKS